MLRSLTARQFAEWEHFVQLEGPLGEIRQDYRTASILQMLANVNRAAKQKPYTLEDFLLKFGEQDEEKPRRSTKQTWQEQKALLLGPILAAYSVPAEDA